MMDRDFLSVLAKRTGKPDGVESLFTKGDDGNEVLVDTWKETVNGWIDNWQAETNKRAQLHGASTTAKNYRDKLAGFLELEEASDEAIFSTLEALKSPTPTSKPKAEPNVEFEKAAEALRAERDKYKRLHEESVSKWERENLTRAAHSRALEHLASINWNAGSDEATRQRRTKHIMDIIDAHIALGKLKKDGAELAIFEGGERAKDSDYKPVSFESYVSGLNAFGVHAGNPKNGSPAPVSNGSSGSKSTVSMSMDQILDQYAKETDPERKAALRKAMKAHR